MSRNDQILGAAADLFHRQGYHGTSVEEIASAVGLQKSSLYHYIDGKDQVLRQLAEATIAGYLADAERIAAGAGTAGERLTRLIEAHILRLCAAPERVTVLVRESHLLPAELAVEVRAMTSRYTHRIAALIQEGIDSGEFAPVDPTVASLMLLGALNWAHRWYQPDGRLSPESIGLQYADVILAGLRRRSD